MQMFYNGDHRVFFGEMGVMKMDEHGNITTVEAKLKDSWADWHLVPTSRPVIAPPPVKKNTIEIIGANSMIDLTEIPRGFPTYGNRTGSLEFYVDHSQNWGKDCDQEYDWVKAYDEIKAYLHGYKMKMYLGDELDYYYYGRFEVNNWKSDKTLSTITINYDLDPYKLSTYSTLEEWEWDPFDFYFKLIPDYNPTDYRKDLSEGHYIIYQYDKIGAMPVAPTIYVTNVSGQLYAQVWSSYSGRWGSIVPITSGEENLGLILSTPRAEDKVQINFYSDATGTPATSGNVAIDFRPGRL